MKKIWVVISILLLAAVLLAACGGGGGGVAAPTAASATYTISGTVTQTGTGVQGVTMTLSGASTASASTGANGSYSFSGLANGTYLVTPSMAGRSMTPLNRSVTVSGANMTGQDFTSTTAATYSISGTITVSGGGALSGVTMSLTGDNTASVTTNASGVYTFSGLVNGTYTVTPSLSGYTFTPTSRSVTINSANSAGDDFVATAVPSTFTLSGTVNLSGGGALPGVLVTLSGANSGTATTDASGNYSFGGLVNGGYTVTPTMAGYTFNPASSTQTVNGSNITGVNFTSSTVGSDFVGTWNGSMVIESENRATTLTLFNTLTGSFITQGANVTGTHNLTTPATATNGTLLFDLPLSDEDAANAPPIDCAGWSVSCSGTLSNSNTTLTLSCAGLVCGPGGVQPFSWVDTMAKQ